jgi:hypothetical protein
MTLLSSCTSEASVLACAVAARLITVLFRLLMSYKIWEREVEYFCSRYVVCDMVCAYRVEKGHTLHRDTGSIKPSVRGPVSFHHLLLSKTDK